MYTENKTNTWLFVSLFSQTVTEIVAEHTGSIRDSVNQLKKESIETKKQIRNIEQMLERLLKHSGVKDEDDDFNWWLS